MRILRYFLCLMLAAMTLSSCIRKEPLNTECDITSVTLGGDVLNRLPQIGNNTVLLVLKDNVSADALAPEFTLTPGATINPPSGTVRDFREPQQYTVTSQDGEWKKVYTVTVQTNLFISLKYDFEHVRLGESNNKQYDVFYQPGLEGENELTWASANSAFALLTSGGPDAFPTFQGDNGVNGKCAVLVTRATGPLGSLVGKPIAAGNLFFGSFDGTSAMTNPLGATHFGIPFNNIPTHFSGFYKYTPGDVFKRYEDVNGKREYVEVPGKVDIFNLYAVMYVVTEAMPYLDGSNVLSKDNPNIICTAEIPDRHASEDWVYFNVPFKYREGKSIDPDKLAAGLYNIAIVASASEDGDTFAGAVGSNLRIDELELTCSTED